MHIIYVKEDIKSNGDNDDDDDDTKDRNVIDESLINKYSDISLESIDNLLKREEIRMKQRMECGNYDIIEPLTKRRQNRHKLGEKESF